MRSPEPDRAGRLSELRAAFEERDGFTRLSRCYHTAPLKIAKVFPLSHGGASVYIMDASPGLMAGDAYRIEWDLGSGSRVFATTQSYAKLHPSAERPSRQSVKASLAAGAVMEYFPEPVIPYGDSAFIGDMRIDLSPGSVWMSADILCPGRTLRGETFAFKLYENRIQVYEDEQLIYTSGMKLQPQLHSIQSIGGWGDYTHLATLLLFSDRIEAGVADKLRDTLEGCGGVLGGVSLTYRHGLAVTMLGTRVWELERAVKALWDKAREVVLGWPPADVRK